MGDQDLRPDDFDWSELNAEAEGDDTEMGGGEAEGADAGMGMYISTPIPWAYSKVARDVIVHSLFEKSLKELALFIVLDVDGADPDVYLPGKDIGEGEVLVFDPSAYVCMTEVELFSRLNDTFVVALIDTLSAVSLRLAVFEF